MLKECKVLLGLTLAVFLLFFAGCGDGELFDFSTPETPDTTKPSVTSQLPSNGAIGVEVDTTVSASFSDPSGVYYDSFSLVAGSSSVERMIDETGLTFTPSQSLDYNTKYTATISNVRDGAGNTLGNVSWSFTTTDSTKPSVTSQSPPNGATGVAVDTEVSATFFEGVYFDSFTLTSASGVSRSSTSAGNGSSTVSFSPSNVLNYGITYTATITNVRNSAGNVLGDVSWSFTTTSSAPLHYEATPDASINDVGKYNSLVIGLDNKTSYITYNNYGPYSSFDGKCAPMSLCIISTIYATSFTGPYLIAGPTGLETVGEYVSSVMDSAGKFHVAYYHEGVGLRYATASSSSGPWSITTVDPAVIEDCEDTWNETPAPTGVTLSMDAATMILGAASAKFVMADTAIAGIVGTEAIPETNLSNAASISLWVASSVALNSGDFQLLLDNTAGCASPLKTLNIPALNANTWTKVTLDLGDASTLSKIISIGLRMAVDKGAMDFWIDQVHMPVGKYTSIALDSTEKVHISYYDEGNTALKYATNASGAWVKSTIDSGLPGENPGLYTSIKVNAGTVHISYYDSATKTLRYYNPTMSPPIIAVDSTGNVGEFSSLYVDNNGKVYIVYNIVSNANKQRYIRVKTNASGIWQHFDITAISSGFKTSNPIVVDSNGIFHLSYFDYNAGVISLLYRTGLLLDAYNNIWDWSTAKLVDGSGINNGVYSSIAIDSNSKARISYYDASKGDLKFAFYY